jgi:catechol 2,3-dioxygenase-like lactoylglutathione lyase family enzyme
VGSSGARVAGLNHVSVTVRDMERSLAFWRDGLGLPLTGRGVVEREHLDRIVGLEQTVIEWAELALPRGMIELFRYVRPPGADLTRPHRPNDPGSVHICLEVVGVDAILASLKQRGYASRSPSAVTIPDGDWAGWRDVYVESPDGVIVELSEGPGVAAAQA